MISCKLCGTDLDRKKIRRDGSLLCPVCGQIYWKKAVDLAMRAPAPQRRPAHISLR